MEKDLEYYHKNCEENYLTTPISVLRYISELEKANDTLTENNKILTRIISKSGININD